MTNSLRTGLPIAFSAALLSASSVASAGFNVGDYVVDRGHDFLDIFRLRAGAPDGGHGYGAKARATALAQVGYVNFEGYYTGMNRRGFGTSHEDRQEGGVSIVYFSEHMMETLSGNVFLDESTDWAKVKDRRLERKLPYWDDGQGDFLGIGAEVATPVLALDVGVYPSQAVDFLGGFVTLDPYLDDRLTLAREPWEPMEPTVAPTPDTQKAMQERSEELARIRSTIEGYEDDVNTIEGTQTEPADEENGDQTLILDAKPIDQIEGDESEPMTEDTVNEVIEESRTEAPVESDESMDSADETSDSQGSAVREVTEDSASEETSDQE